MYTIVTVMFSNIGFLTDELHIAALIAVWENQQESMNRII